ncbi:MAG: hypothetical protein HYV07_03150 [Deltaproteobacteria bacterium]|nr:hypothetical protein [Deltaproteobacteria bacterium]
MSRRSWWSWLVPIAAGLGMTFAPATTLAGMPFVSVDDLARLRLEALGFFLGLFFGVAWLFRKAWNALARDWTALPTIGYRAAVGAVFVFGLGFHLLLTMISGARELMTPGAWEKSGATYVLKVSSPDRLNSRLAELEELERALRSFADSHSGRFPPHPYAPGIPISAFVSIDGARFVYLPGGTLDGPADRIVAVEPKGLGEPRLALYSGGQIRAISEADLARALHSGAPK